LITVRFKLSGPLREYYRHTPSAKGEEVELPDGANVADLLEEYGMPAKKAHLIIVNRLRGNLETVLQGGDEVWLLPLAAGG